MRNDAQVALPCESGDFHAGREPAGDARVRFKDVSAAEVGDEPVMGRRIDPLANGDGNRRFSDQPLKAGDIVLRAGLFKKGDVLIREPVRQRQRLIGRIAPIRVHRDEDLVADVTSHGADPRERSVCVGPEANFHAGDAPRERLVEIMRVPFRRRIEHGRACGVHPHRCRMASEQFCNRLSLALAQQIPEGDLDRAGGLARYSIPAQIPVEQYTHLVCASRNVERIAADKVRSQHILDDGAHDGGVGMAVVAARLAIAHAAVVGRDLRDSVGPLHWRMGLRMAQDDDGDAGDLHVDP